MTLSKLLYRAAVFAALLQFSGVSIEGWAAPPPGQEVFKKRCGSCHDLPDPDSPPPDGWSERLDLMAPMAGLSSDEKATVLVYLQSHVKKEGKAVSLEEERRLFEDKCSLCHTPDRVFVEPLTEESRQHIVKRMQERAPDWISPDEAALILDYLSKVPAKGKKKVSGDAQTIFRNRCSACHALERVYVELEEHKTPSWMHIVKRMREKAPNWIKRKEAEQILAYLKTLKPVKKGK